MNDLKEYDIEDNMRDIVFVINDKNYQVIKGIGEKRDDF